jgi:hypothetical protein
MVLLMQYEVLRWLGPACFREDAAIALFLSPETVD